ncbi:structural protein [Edwardsiella phage eiAU-183]|uniref:Structural protein n=3 Tax=Viruses TaxID=10239 RepID=W0LLX9_9CAUD|nr:head closure Hc1 [Edwardsiella phage eiAU-183]YP_009613898.1 head closure Hc1 [Edwardsiella phage eiAU]AHG23464.1 structural protein [Edwardsiella phage eiAU]AHG23518.1 structural protein [Edwardsiella phage eiAU-183]
MMALNYRKLQKTADRLLSQNGMAATVTRPAWVERVGVDEIIHPAETFTITGVLAQYKPMEIDGTRIMAGDVRFAASGAGAEVKTGDLVTILGKQYRVITPNPAAPNGSTVIAYNLQLRG